MTQEKLAQDKKRETSNIKNKVETMKEDNKKLLSPKGALVFSEHNREHATALTAFYQPKTKCPRGTAFSKSK